MTKMLGKVKALVVSTCAILTSLNAKQRKIVYRVAAGAGLALAAKFGIDAHTVQAWGETAGVFVTTVLVPVLAHSKVSGD